MQQLDIVYSGIKGAILVRKNSGPPTVELPLILKPKKKKTNLCFPRPSLKYIILHCHSHYS